ncbi:MAG: hypothetical protein QM736_26170, partial [Vicinamibacterales bacterium]
CRVSWRTARFADSARIRSQRLLPIACCFLSASEHCCGPPISARREPLSGVSAATPVDPSCVDRRGTHGCGIVSRLSPATFAFQQRPPLHTAGSIAYRRTSVNGKYRLIYQIADGNVVLYRETDHQPIWATNTFVLPGYVEMQADGNLVQWDVYGVPH